MSTQDYDQIEKIFNGSWKYDRDENLEAFMVAFGKRFDLSLFPLHRVDSSVITLWTGLFTNIRVAGLFL